MPNLYGYDVVVSAMCDPRPHMTPSAEFRRLMTPEMVEDLEVWMLEFFGATEAVQYVSETERKIFIGHRAWEQLKHLALPDVPRAPSILDGWRL